MTTNNLGYDKLLKALQTISYCEKHPTLRERFWRWMTRDWAKPSPPPASYLMLTVVGAHGHQSAQARIPRRPPPRSFWHISQGRTVNIAPIMLELTVDGRAPYGARWLITDEHGRLLFEGQFRRAIEGCEVPAGWLGVHE